MTFEAMDDSLIIGLNMSSEIWLEEDHDYVLQIIRNNVTRAVVLQENDSTTFRSKLAVPIFDPFTI